MLILANQHIITNIDDYLVFIQNIDPEDNNMSLVKLNEIIINEYKVINI